MSVQPKKHLGQHFLTDENICKKIVAQYVNFKGANNILEIGPGMGAITKYFLDIEGTELHVMEIDKDSVEYLSTVYPQLQGKIHSDDFLKTDLSQFFDKSPFAVVGNFPYNISSQILFHCIEYRNQIPEIMGMFQKEVAERVAEPPGSKKYGILSVLMQTYYDIEYCFTVHENVFNPPPKVKSGVIRCLRNDRTHLPVDEELYKRIIKATFNQRRKTIRNGLKLILDVSLLPDHPFLKKRAETLSVDDFIQLTQIIEETIKEN
ncbi:16S rRNA (adenine(1518)-N(6)/adenine(1519)-N(6))-dimethyltransferase RsmA [Brumimicrobium aurantiacum]|uniref:Ribosomal RNA small subunit methyltransferase A n=1 Tax=Brumimicrobium aurantiacum TaxID=1737063 RepID=A0A3E1F2L2_9FLAO|nr:16S rRNA (adenine(1518)-N(6)/adenine(1519)-N(6))-dimethyltransferase RsmA [Brumimicrobium aurantiacum]RFC55947.1 16S rRNA (adenine(1518)-N(6)/adenine(1519)-N(6))-dimethyltransferase RsmA [Brumimicrobium aurantiacum]